MGKITKYLELVDATDMSLKEHDAKYHPDGYDSKTQTCEFRERRAKLDPVDGDVKPGGISGLYTGTAANYSRPSVNYIGTGEGSQVYGWGLYASNQRGVAEGYAGAAVQDRDGLLFDGEKIPYISRYSPSSSFERATAAILNADGDMDVARENLEANAYNLFGGVNERGMEALKWFDANKHRYSEKKPAIYEQTFFTNRAPGDESHLLKWYEPVSEENMKRIVKAIDADSPLNNEYSKTLLKKAKTAFLSNLSNRIGNKGIEEATGADVYKAISELYNTNREQNASEFLARADIDGVKYPVDSYGGKTVKDGDTAGWNYVSFRDDNIRTDRKFVDGKEVDVKDECCKQERNGKCKLGEYLSLVETSDMTYTAHLRRYHPNGITAETKCKIIENAKKKQARMAAEKERQMELPFDKGYERQALEEYARRIRKLDDVELRKELDKIDDDNHPNEMKLWVAERNRREAKDLGKKMDDLGERA